MKIKRIRLILFFLIFSFSLPPTLPAKALQLEGWLEDANGYARALDQYGASDKIMVVYVHADWCPYCRELERHVLLTPQVKAFLEDAIKVRMDAEAGAREERLASKYGVRAYPSVFIHAPSRGRGLEAPKQMPLTETPSDFIREFQMILRALIEEAKRKDAQAGSRLGGKETPPRPGEEINPTHVMVLRNGREIIGELLSSSEEEVIFRTQDAGTVTFQASEVSSVELI